MNLHYASQKLSTHQWNLYNFRLPLTIVVILVVTISATGSARLPLDLYFNLCKTRTPLSFQLTKIHLAMASAIATSQTPFDLFTDFKLNEICLTKFQLQVR